MENNNKPLNAAAETAKTIAAVNNSNAEPATEEIVIYDECGDTMWDRVLAQSPLLELKANENIDETKM